MKYFIYMSLLLSTLFGLNGCANEEVIKSPVINSVSHTILHSGQFIEFGTSTNKASKIFTSQTSYELELAKYSSAQSVALDFTKNRVLLVDMGSKSSGGYSIAIVDVANLTDHVVVYVNLLKPGAGCITTSAITNPFQFVQIETNNDDVVIKESLLTHQC